MAFLGSAPGGSRLTDLGQSVGTGLSKGISALMESKLESLQRSQAEKEFESYGYPKHHSKLFARYRNNPQIIKLLQNYASEENDEQPQQVDERNYLEQLQNTQRGNQQEFYNQPTGVSQQDNLEQIFKSLSNPMGISQAQRGQVPQQYQQKASQEVMQPSQQQRIIPIQQQEKTSLGPPSFNSKSKSLELRKKSSSAQEINKAQSETKQFYIDTTKQAEAAKKNDARLNRMENLIEKGSLPISTFYNISKNLSETEGFKSIPLIGGIINPIANGIGFGLREIQKNITSRDLEEFEKLSNSFVDQAKSMFGSRLTDADLKAFMATVPTLSNTDAGKKQIITSMKAAGKAAILKDKAMKQVIKENKGMRPFDLEAEVETRIQPELDKLSNEFIGNKSLSLI